jgi:nucleoside-diphosphate-sugar epimerase
MTFTILGASGFVGGAMARYLSAKGYKVLTPDQRRLGLDEINKHVDGHVIYCVGLTGNFRSQPFSTFDAHVGILKLLLMSPNFESLTYLSSTRVYFGGCLANEDADLNVNPGRRDDIYNISKLMGESFCREAYRQGARVIVVRLSNVLGNAVSTNKFLSDLWGQAKTFGKIDLASSLSSKKDYVSIEDVVEVLEKIATRGTFDTYNLASGVSVSNEDIVRLIHKRHPCNVVVRDNADENSFPNIDISRIKGEFNFVPQDPVQYINTLFDWEWVSAKKSP